MTGKPDQPRFRFTRDVAYLAVIAALLALSGQLWYEGRYLPSREVSVYYNQETELNREVIRAIQDARAYVYFAIYTFTRQDIKNALLAAKYRGLEVRGVTDAEQARDVESQRKIVSELRAAGIPVAEDDHSGIMHLKVLVTDRSYVSGSYNWTTSATDSNDEVLEVGTDPSVRSSYERVILRLLDSYGN